MIIITIMQLIAPHPETRIALDLTFTAKPLLTPSESRLLESLDQLTRGRCRIMAKPRLADFIQHHDGIGGFNTISQKHVDFLICRHEDCLPMIAIELDDPSHRAKDRQKRDQFVNAVFAQIGLPLLRIDVTELEQVERMVSRLSDAWTQRWSNLSLLE